MTIDSTVRADVFAPVARRSLEAGAVLRLTVDDLTMSCPSEIARAIIELLDATSADVNLAQLPAELTTGQVAGLLGVSRPTVVSLVDSGDLPASRVGTHRRVRAVDALAYRDAHRSERRAALDELTQISARAGLYD